VYIREAVKINLNPLDLESAPGVIVAFLMAIVNPGEAYGG